MRMPPRRSVPRQASLRHRSEQVETANDGEQNGKAAPTGGGLSSSSSSTNSTPQTSNISQQKAWSGPAPVAIDLGAYTVRVTIGHDPKTSVLTCCPNAIVRMPQQQRYNHSKDFGSHQGSGSGAASGAGLPSNSLVGPDILTRCADFGSLAFRQPMDRGLVVDWAAQKIILDAALAEALAQEEKVKQANDASNSAKGRLLDKRPVVITEAYFNLPDLQAAMDLLLFEEYGAASIWRSAPVHILPYTPNLFTTPIGVERRRARPECMCIVDLGHGASHIVPVIGDAVIWRAARRHVISQRLVTNLLKEALSFRQWDMMDESWLVGHIKETCCFVAGNAGRRGDGVEALIDINCSEWSFAALTEMCQHTSRARNPIVQEYVLPDYSGPSLASRFGHIRRGPGRQKDASKRNNRIGLSDDAFVADTTLAAEVVHGVSGRRHDKDATDGAVEDEEEEEDDDDDEDFDVEASRDADSDVEADSQPVSKKQKSLTATKKKDATKPHREDDDSEQVLVLERERFQVPEVIFNPGIIGLDDAPLHEVVKASIEACDLDAQGPLWGNIVLVGGGAAMRGLKRRLYNELRPLAPAGCPLNIWSPPDPSMATIHAVQSMLASAAGTAPYRTLKSRLLPSSEYSAAAARERFGSWAQELRSDDGNVAAVKQSK